MVQSPWDAAELNRRRVELLEADPRTRSRPRGVLILDDSGVPKKGEATQGVKRQYIGQLGNVANGQVFVTSHYAEPNNKRAAGSYQGSGLVTYCMSFEVPHQVAVHFFPVTTD